MSISKTNQKQAVCTKQKEWRRTASMPGRKTIIRNRGMWKCMECRQQKQRQWLVRMSEELRQEPNAYFITLTIDDKSYSKISNTYNITDNNEIATKAIRLCLERIRKQTGKSIKHWFITELGHKKTERLHLRYRDWETDRKSTRLNSSHRSLSRMPSSA